MHRGGRAWALLADLGTRRPGIWDWRSLWNSFSLRVSAKLSFSPTCSPILAFSVSKAEGMKICVCLFPKRQGWEGRGKSATKQNFRCTVIWRSVCSLEMKQEVKKEGSAWGSERRKNRESRWEGQSVYHCHHPYSEDRQQTPSFLRLRDSVLPSQCLVFPLARKQGKNKTFLVNG